MAYNQDNLLDRIEKAQAVWAAHNLDDRTTLWIYKKHIKDTFHISKRTFDSWLSRNVTKERRALAEKTEASKQPSLFDDLE